MRIRCDQCRAELMVADELLGRLVRCGKCQHTFKATPTEAAVTLAPPLSATIEAPADPFAFDEAPDISRGLPDSVSPRAASRIRGAAREFATTGWIFNLTGLLLLIAGIAVFAISTVTTGKWIGACIGAAGFVACASGSLMLIAARRMSRRVGLRLAIASAAVSLLASILLCGVGILLALMLPMAAKPIGLLFFGIFYPGIRVILLTSDPEVRAAFAAEEADLARSR